MLWPAKCCHTCGIPLQLLSGALTPARRARQGSVVASAVVACFDTAATELDEFVLRLGRAQREHDIDADAPLAIGTWR